MHGQILGPVQNDDDADLQITIIESGGVAAALNFIRLTCSNNAQTEWGASSFANEWGMNLIPGGTTVTLVRHYRCPASGRPRLILADLTDVNGFHHVITAAPFHPDWP
jgi:hypothetical protein